MYEVKLTEQKLKGAYYTPRKIVDFLTSWAIYSKNCQLLEPSCGDGIFLESAFARYRTLGASRKSALTKINAIELEFSAFNKAKGRLLSISDSIQEKPAILNGDFFSIFQKYLQSRKFDSVVGNPPFIRYQNFEDEVQKKALELLKKFGFRSSKLINIWMPFLVLSSILLNENGRLAMIIPAELLQVNYAYDLRQFLATHFASITIFTFRKLVFPGIQQEIILLLGEKTSKNHGIKVIELNDLNDLNEKCFELINRPGLNSINHTTDKWTQYFLSKKEILFLRNLKHNESVKKLSELAEVDVGIVTGRNEFFVVNNEITEKNSLSSYAIPIVSRTNQIKSINFTQSDWKRNFENNENCNLLDFNGKKYSSINKKTQQYIRNGEKRGFNTGYKCRIRKPWYNVPSIWIPDAFMYRQIYMYPKLVLNNSKATVTDTIHRVRIKENVDKKSFTICFHNSLTLAFAEIMGRSYGGGVLELEPNEAEELPIPYFKCNHKLLTSMDKYLREENSMEKVLDNFDKILLEEKMGLSKSEITMLKNIRIKLAKRRLERKFSKQKILKSKSI